MPSTLSRLSRAAALALLLPLGLPAPAGAESLAGALLAAQAASNANDYAAAARYYAQALSLAPDDPELREQAVIAFLGKGDFESARALASELDAGGFDSQIGELVLIADATRRGAFAEALERFDRGAGFSPLLDGLLRAWLLLGTGDAEAALAAFDKMAGSETLGVFGQAHKALALAMVGDFEGADRILSGGDGGALRIDRTAVIAHAQILAQLDRRDEAIAVLDQALDGRSDAEAEALRARLAAGEPVGWDVITTPAEGVAEVFYVIASALGGQGPDRLALIYARLGQFIDPERVKILLLVAQILEDQDQHALAIALYDQVPPEHPMFVEAGIGRANALFASGDEEGAVAALRALAADHSGDEAVHAALGDTLRRLSRFAEAAEAYSAAIALIEAPQPSHWFLFYSRGICWERTGQWEKAEADFRKALELSPDQPLVLNYLGYSLVERRERLDEALEMIRKAVQKRPDDGYITDSLGWAYFRLGRYDEAVPVMEHAVELTPLDPIITDHLGDVYWAVGRKREARFQWWRALSLGPEEKDAARIRRKLELGLDAVLAEEGEPPIIANGN
ncbi:MAG: tetratricopeptide repeat protein [Alphaproteobacteria bacterium]|nr:MAG: tetratricopeptide repeat protein [Alphaproteobacteria bacterium]